MGILVSKPSNVKRSVRLISPLDQSGKNGEMEITMQSKGKTEVFRYWLDCIPSPSGRAFLVEKQGNGTDLNEEYTVQVDNAQDHACTCPGFTYHQRCKHSSAIRKLLELGKI